MRNLYYTLMLGLLSTSTFAQATSDSTSVAGTATPASVPGFLGTGNVALDFLFVAIALLAIILLVVAIVLLNTFKKLSRELTHPSPISTEPDKRLEFDEWMALQKKQGSTWNKILGLKPIEQEKDLLLDHEFDGIAELDNPTPAWFMWLFYITIAIAAGYLFTYHVAGWAKLQDDEYVAEVEQAKAEKDAMLKNSGTKIDENTVTISKDAAVLSAGEAIYKGNCVACHGDKGQGLVGPNLTDEYWLHGGKIGQVFKTITYGVPDKGMIAWGKSLSPKQISDVANYVESLKGTNPANAKAPQGEKEVAEAAEKPAVTTADSTATKG